MYEIYLRVTIASAHVWITIEYKISTPEFLTGFVTLPMVGKLPQAESGILGSRFGKRPLYKSWGRLSNGS